MTEEVTLLVVVVVPQATWIARRTPCRCTAIDVEALHSSNSFKTLRNKRRNLSNT